MKTPHPRVLTAYYVLAFLVSCAVLTAAIDSTAFENVWLSPHAGRLIFSYALLGALMGSQHKRAQTKLLHQRLVIEST